MKNLYLKTFIIFLTLLITGAFCVANASSGYTKTINIDGNNEVEYTFIKDKEPIVTDTVRSKTTIEKIFIPYNNYGYPYYNQYTYNPNSLYNYGGSYIYIKYPRTYIYHGFKQNPPMHRPNIKPPHKPPIHPPNPPMNGEKPHFP